MSLIACSSSQDSWPRLSEPLPDASDRERVITRLSPTPPPAMSTGSGESVPTTLDAAYQLMNNTRGAFSAQLERLKSIDVSTSEAWHDAQLALTRLSHISANLNVLKHGETPTLASAYREAALVQANMDTIIVAMRKQLHASPYRPQ